MKALGYLKKLKDPKFLFYLHFFMDFVIILRQLSLEFQRDELLIIDIESKIQSANVKLDMLSVHPGKHYKRLTDELSVDINGDIVYKEVILEKSTTRTSSQIYMQAKMPNDYKEFFDKKFGDILSAADTYLTSRFNDLTKPLLSNMIKIFDYRAWPPNFRDSKLSKQWGFKELEELVSYYEQH